MHIVSFVHLMWYDMVGEIFQETIECPYKEKALKTWISYKRDKRVKLVNITREFIHDCLFSGAGAGAAGGKGKGGGMSQLKMQAMALGGSGGQVALKELAVSPAAVVVSREKEKLALQELNDR